MAELMSEEETEEYTKLTLERFLNTFERLVNAVEDLVGVLADQEEE